MCGCVDVAPRVGGIASIAALPSPHRCVLIRFYLMGPSSASSSRRMISFRASRAAVFLVRASASTRAVVFVYSHCVYPIVTTTKPTMPVTNQADILT